MALWKFYTLDCAVVLLLRSCSVHSIDLWEDADKRLKRQDIACNTLVVPKAGIGWTNNEYERDPSYA